MTAPEPSPAFIEVESLRQTLGGHPVLRGVTFTVPQGKTTVILGGSGAGKSVLLKHLNGLLRPSSGLVKVEGVDLATLSERALTPIRRKIGMLFQDGALFDSMTVGENVAFPLRESGDRDEARIRYRVEEVLELVGLKGQEGKMPAALSGGMRKRVSLARGIAGRPACMLYDEPTAGNLGAMRYLADQVIFLKHGEIHFAGTPAGLAASDDRSIREFVYADEMGRP